MLKILVVLLLGVTIAACGSSVPSATGVAACDAHVAVVPVSLTVEGEEATGLLYEPFRNAPGDLDPHDLIVFAHGHTDTAASFADILCPLAGRTSTPLITMDQRSFKSRWKPGEWNVWAGWQDTVAATQWYKQLHPGITRTILWGWSQGGATSGLALVHGPRKLYDYWVDSFGIVNAIAAWAVESVVDPTFAAEIVRDAGGCTPAQCPDAYIARSPDINARRIDVKRAFVLHGVGDTTVPYPQSTELTAALVASGVPVSVYTLSP